MNNIRTSWYDLILRTYEELCNHHKLNSLSYLRYKNTDIIISQHALIAESFLLYLPVNFKNFNKIIFFHLVFA